MVVELVIQHTYKYPLEQVVRTHFNKYPTPKEKHVLACNTLETKIDYLKGVQFYKRVAICINVIPEILRRSKLLQVENIFLEELIWLNKRQRCMDLKSHNITWAEYANCKESSSYTVHPENPNWTRFEQKGSIDIVGFGKLNKVMEVFGKSFLQQGSERSISIMEGLLHDNFGKPNQDSGENNKKFIPLVHVI